MRRRRHTHHLTSRSSCFSLNRRWAGVSMSSMSSTACSSPSPALSFFPPPSEPDPPTSAPSAADPELTWSSMASSCALLAASAASRLRFPFFLQGNQPRKEMNELVQEALTRYCWRVLGRSLPSPVQQQRGQACGRYRWIEHTIY